MKAGYHVRRYTPRMIASRARIDRLAEHMANGGTFDSFAFREDLTPEGVRGGAWRTIVRELGWQAR